MIVKPERRDFMRLAMDSEATVRPLSGGDPVHVSLVDLSASGCAFHSDRHFEPGEALEVLITSPDEAIEPFRQRAEVIRVTPEDNGPLTAVRFGETAR